MQVAWETMSEFISTVSSSDPVFLFSPTASKHIGS